jgi:hypothetical protein
MKLPYFKLKDAFNEARDSFSYGDGATKLTSAAKLVGKTVANAGMLVTEMGVEAIKRAPEIAGSIAKKNLDQNSGAMTLEQRVKSEEMIRKGDEARDMRLEKEREKSLSSTEF